MKVPDYIQKNFTIVAICMTVIVLALFALVYFDRATLEGVLLAITSIFAALFGREAISANRIAEAERKTAEFYKQQNDEIKERLK